MTEDEVVNEIIIATFLGCDDMIDQAIEQLDRPADEREEVREWARSQHQLDISELPPRC